MGYIHTININDQNQYLIEPLLFATTSGTADIIEANITNFELVDGVLITLQITTANNANATLSINNGEAKAIYYQGNLITSNILKQNHTYNLIYKNNTWIVIGEKLSESEMILPHKLTFGAGQVYTYDGSQDVNVPVYTGGIY